MCGISGAIGISDKTLLRKMTDVLRHRGPDDTGFYVDDRLMLGQCRLSVIDLKTGRQPIYNEDRSVVLVYNGEIYNFRELRYDLEGRGHSFYTSTDSEIVVHAYEQYGQECVKYFNGMFAFALYDSHSQRLLLARDRQGIKPLYYAMIDGVLVFASEIKSILRYPGAPRKLDFAALNCFLTLRYVPLEKTVFSGIRKLLPGHYALYDGTSWKDECYWRLQPMFDRDKVSRRGILDILERCIGSHMISDVPVGVYLSGGLDSATIVALASRISDQPLNTFCMGFGEDTDELEDARLIADHFGTDHHETVVNDTLLFDFPKMIWHIDSPKRNLYTYYLARLASKNVKVVLSGLGGDELFAGYDFRYNVLTQRNPRTVEEKIARYLSTQARDVPPDQNEVYGSTTHKAGNRCAHHFLAAYFEDSLPFMEQVLVADFNAKMVYDFLPIDDATSMAHSVETRVPFLDNELVDLAFGIPFSLKFREGRGKLALRQAVSSILPRRALEKKKRGFGPNPFEVYRKELRSYAENWVPRGLAVSKRLVNPDWVRKILSRTPSPEQAAEYNKLWDCLSLEIFLRIYFDGDVLENPTWDAL